MGVVKSVGKLGDEISTFCSSIVLWWSLIWINDTIWEPADVATGAEIGAVGTGAVGVVTGAETGTDDGIVNKLNTVPLAIVKRDVEYSVIGGSVIVCILLA